MKDLYQYIKARINTRVPAIKTVRLYNSQMLHGNESEKKDEKFFPTPAVFIEFVENEIANYSQGIKDVGLTVRFRFSKVGYKFDRPETFDFMDAFDDAIQLMAPIKDGTLTFTTFQEQRSDYDENHNNVENPIKEYFTTYRRQSGYNKKTAISISGTKAVISYTFGNTIDFSQLYNSGLTTIISTF